MLVAAGLAAIVIASGHPLNWPRLAAAAGAAAPGIVFVLSVPLALGFDYISPFNGIMSLHRDHYTTTGRSLRFRFNLLDFSIFPGWPLIAWLVALNSGNHKDPAQRLVLTLTACVALIDLADLTRSEVGRLWMPLMPLIFAGSGVAASMPASTEFGVAAGHTGPRDQLAHHRAATGRRDVRQLTCFTAAR